MADGYGNRRVIVFDADTGAFKRMWGAFGNVPVDAPAGRGAAPAAAPRAGGTPPAGGTQPAAPAPAPATTAGAGRGAPGAGRGAAPPLETDGPGPQQFGGPVHSVKVSNDGVVYVADRPNRRMQVFDPDGKYLTQMFINRAGPAVQSVAGIAFSPDSGQRFMYRRRLRQFARAWSSSARRSRCCTSSATSARSPETSAGRITWRSIRRATSTWRKSVPGNRAQRFVLQGDIITTPPTR